MKKYPKDKTLALLLRLNQRRHQRPGGAVVYEKGYSQVYALKGGWKEWSRSKYPVENK